MKLFQAFVDFKLAVYKLVMFCGVEVFSLLEILL